MQNNIIIYDIKLLFISRILQQQLVQNTFDKKSDEKIYHHSFMLSNLSTDNDTQFGILVILEFLINSIRKRGNNQN